MKNLSKLFKPAIAVCAFLMFAGSLFPQASHPEPETLKPGAKAPDFSLPGVDGKKFPFTLLVEPGGKIIYKKQDMIDPHGMKKTIVESKYIGRYY